MLMKNRVTGIGGIFFTTKDTEALRAWYDQHLGIKSESWGCSFPWRQQDNPEKAGSTAWCLFRMDTDYFQPSQHPYMLNYRVENLDELLTILESEGVEILPARESSEFGKFAWILDPEGRKIELWEPAEGM